MPLDNISKFANLDDYLNQEIPAELADRLRVAGRIEQILKPTITSAVSTSAQEPTPPRDIDNEIDDLIDHVAAMEDLIEQLEDMADDQLKDMAIPPATPRVAAAAKSLGSPDGTVNKDVLDQAQLINQVAPMLLIGTDPIAATLTGEGILDKKSGVFLNCNEITRSIVRQLEFLQNSEIDNPEIALDDLNQQIQAAHEDSLGRIMIDIILKMLWNIIWVKLIVDHGIINPARVLVANPLDSLILFFKEECGRFRRPSNECRKSKGPINIALNKLRITLICKIPPIFYPRFNPMEHGVVCPKEEKKCPPLSEGRSMEGDKDLKKEGSLQKMTEIADELFPELCVSSDMLLGLARCFAPDGPGLPPECYSNAVTVLEAILDDALTPDGTRTKDESTESQVIVTTSSGKAESVTSNAKRELSAEELRLQGCSKEVYNAR